MIGINADNHTPNGTVVTDGNDSGIIIGVQTLFLHCSPVRHGQSFKQLPQFSPVSQTLLPQIISGRILVVVLGIMAFIIVVLGVVLDVELVVITLPPPPILGAVVVMHDPQSSGHEEHISPYSEVQFPSPQPTVMLVFIIISEANENFEKISKTKTKIKIISIFFVFMLISLFNY